MIDAMENFGIILVKFVNYFVQISLPYPRTESRGWAQLFHVAGRITQYVTACGLFLAYGEDSD